MQHSDPETRQTVPAGRINKSFGTGGGVMLTLYPAFPNDFDLDTPLLVDIDGLDVPLYCELFERRGTTGATAAFADFDSEHRARELLGREFRIAQDTAEDEDAFCLEDLIGFTAVAREAGQRARHTGTVADYYDSEANPLFELELDGRRILVPAAEEFIARIDFEARTMHLILPEGLLNLE